MPDKVGGFGLVAKEGEAAESKREEGGGVEGERGGEGGRATGEGERGQEGGRGGKDERESGMKRERGGGERGEIERGRERRNDTVSADTENYTYNAIKIQA